MYVKLLCYKDSSGETALFQAATAGNADIVKILLKQHASVDISNKHDISPLIVAAYHGHSHVCRLLLDRGKAKIDQQDQDQKSALSYAATEGHGQVVETLLNRGADTNIVDKVFRHYINIYYNYIHVALSYNELYVIKYIIFSTTGRR